MKNAKKEYFNYHTDMRIYHLCFKCYDIIKKKIKSKDKIKTKQAILV